MLRIGLTGGIGSGKSTVAKIFSVLDIPVYQADKEAKRLMNTHPDIISGIQSLFSPLAYKNGQLDTSFLSDQAFQHPERLSQLNALVHPYTIEDAKQWMKQQTSPYALKEAALIFESGSQGEFDFIIGVSAPESLRISRAMERDHKKKEEIIDRMRNQMNEDEKLSKCHFILHNDERHLLIPQVLKLHQHFCDLAHQSNSPQPIGAPGGGIA
ncbi:MAG: dephospho-CoA kinase [Chitinophagaceae bacterium]